MSAFDDYKRMKSNANQARGWLSMIGKVYSGGGRGMGDLRSVKVGATIYFQETDGAKNYHESPEPFNLALAKVVKRNWSSLVSEALTDMDGEVEESKKLATSEYRQLLDEEGISTSI